MLHDVAVAAVHLLRQQRALRAAVGEECLGHRRQQIGGGLCRLAIFGAGGVACAIQHQADVCGKRPAALDERPLRQQHPPHVRVDEDRIRRAGCVLRPARCPALQTFAGIGHGVLVGEFGQTQALDADREPRMVHHREHAGQPLVGLSHQVAGRAVVVDERRGAAANAHLVFDCPAGEAVALAVGQHLRHQKERNAAASGGRVRQLRQH